MPSLVGLALRNLLLSGQLRVALLLVEYYLRLGNRSSWRDFLVGPFPLGLLDEDSLQNFTFVLRVDIKSFPHNGRTAPVYFGESEPNLLVDAPIMFVELKALFQHVRRSKKHSVVNWTRRKHAYFRAFRHSHYLPNSLFTYLATVKGHLVF